MVEQLLVFLMFYKYTADNDSFLMITNRAAPLDVLYQLHRRVEARGE